MLAMVRRIPCWVPLGAIVIAALYAPTLQTRFDFIDDGNLVYPTQAMPLAPRMAVVWEKIETNYEHLGPFRPTLWLHLEVEGDLFAGNAFAWRMARLFWGALAPGMVLWVLPGPALSCLAARV